SLICRRADILHFSVVYERVPVSTGGIAVPDHAPVRVNTKRFARGPACQRAEIKKRTVVQESAKGIIVGIACADNLSAIIDAVGIARRAAKRSQILHSAIVQKGVVAAAGVALSDDSARVVDAVRGTP